MDRQPTRHLTMDIKKMTYVVPTSVLGYDDQGRMLVRCPECGDDATILDDGRIACPLGDAISDWLKQEARPLLDAAMQRWLTP
jgi:hypothetical protein